MVLADRFLSPVACIQCISFAAPPASPVQVVNSKQSRDRRRIYRWRFLLLRRRPILGQLSCSAQVSSCPLFPSDARLSLWERLSADAHRDVARWTSGAEVELWGCARRRKEYTQGCACFKEPAEKVNGIGRFAMGL